MRVVCPQVFEDLLAVKSRHFPVADDQVKVRLSDSTEAFLAVARRFHGETTADQGGLNQIEDRFFVVDDQDAFAGALQREPREGGVRGCRAHRCSGCVGDDREVNDEGGACTRRALHPDRAAVFLNDAVGKAEAQTCAFAELFRGEKRIKDSHGIFRRNAGAIVGE